MKKFFVVCVITSFITGNAISAEIASLKSKSVFQSRLTDSAAVYFTPSDFKISANGKTDVSDALQEAIIKLKSTRDCGIVFIPEGKYLITKTMVSTGR
jgi:polygalacturonase